MPSIDVTREDAARLEKINAGLSWRFDISIKEHFNKAGKLADFASAATPAEEAEQLKYVAVALQKDGTLNGVYASLKIEDIFLGVARRLAKDEELAALLPGAYDAADVATLEKVQLPALAAVVKARLGS